MPVHDFIEMMIKRLDNLTITGVNNMNVVLQTINDLNTLKGAIHEAPKEEEHADGQDQ